MHRYLAVLNGDNINRYGYRFTIGALEGTLFENATIGVPSLLGHDSHKPIGWNYPFGLYFEPKITKLIGEFIIAETDDDQETIENAYQNNLLQRNYEACKPYLSEFTVLLKLDKERKGIFMYNGCVSYQDKGLLFKHYPNFKDTLDKNGLTYLDELLAKFDYLGQGIFKDKNSELTIFAHQYFRRNLSRHNNFHSYFLDDFIKLNPKSDVNLRIALDRDMIGFAPTFKEQMELEYWWGPKYNDNIDEIPLGVTHYESDERQKLFTGISGTQFWWKRDKEGMTLELEELREKPSLGVSIERYGCRYIHSIYNSNHSDFMHFDGAIRMYDEESILNRWEQPINQAGKGTEYTKLFRVDGKLGLSDWKALSTNYFQDNTLLYEYFGLKHQYEEIRKELSEVDYKSIVDTLVPYRLDKDIGLKILVSYHTPTEIPENRHRIIINPDVIVRIEDKLDVIEFDMLEVKKAIERLGGELIIPEQYSYIKSNDFYSNYPTILHSNNNLEENLSITLKAYLILFDAISKRLDKDLSFTLAWPHFEKEVRLSIYGNIKEVIKWLKINQNIPLQREAFRLWLEQQNIWLSKNYNYQENNPDLFSLVKNDGVIYIKRNSINPEWITDLREDEKGLKYELQIPKGNEDLYEAIQQEKIFPSFSSIITKVKCGKTNEDYFKSQTSKFLDDDVFVIIEKASLAGAFWTDKQYYKPITGTNTQ